MLDTSHLLRTTKLEGKKRDRSRLKSLGEEINFDGDLDQHKITTNAQNFKFSKKQGLFNGDIIQESNRFIENRRFRQDITPILKEGIVKTPIQDKNSQYGEFFYKGQTVPQTINYDAQFDRNSIQRIDLNYQRVPVDINGQNQQMSADKSIGNDTSGYNIILASDSVTHNSVDMSERSSRFYKETPNHQENYRGRVSLNEKVPPLQGLKLNQFVKVGGSNSSRIKQEKYLVGNIDIQNVSSFRHEVNMIGGLANMTTSGSNFYKAEKGNDRRNSIGPIYTHQLKQRMEQKQQTHGVTITGKNIPQAVISQNNQLMSKTFYDNLSQSGVNHRKNSIETSSNIGFIKNPQNSVNPSFVSNNRSSVTSGVTEIKRQIQNKICNKFESLIQASGQQREIEVEDIFDEVDNIVV